jgi:hypothetical protein
MGADFCVAISQSLPTTPPPELEITDVVGRGHEVGIFVDKYVVFASNFIALMFITSALSI